MVERSTTTATNMPGSSSGRQLDRALGAAVTVSTAVLVFQFTARYIAAQKSKSSSHDDGESWLDTMMRMIKTFVYETSEQIISSVISNVEEEDYTTIARCGSCHCRSIRFEFRAMASIKAKDGAGKIHYPHVRVSARDFRFIAGGSDLSKYYISKPGDSETGGVEPTTAAFAFCGRCGVHILHAPSAHSNVLDVNVECLDCTENKKVPLLRGKHNLSQGVPVSTQWNEEDDLDDEMAADLFTLGPLTYATSAISEDGMPYMEDAIEDPSSGNSVDSSFPLGDRSVHEKPSHFGSIPGTPTTVGTSSTHLRPKSLRSLGSTNSSQASEQRSQLPLLRLPPSRIPPSLDTDLSIESAKGITTTTTPMMRDQLKYYMSKHVSSGKKGQVQQTNDSKPTSN